VAGGPPGLRTALPVGAGRGGPTWPTGAAARVALASRAIGRAALAGNPGDPTIRFSWMAGVSPLTSGPSRPGRSRILHLFRRSPAARAGRRVAQAGVMSPLLCCGVSPQASIGGWRRLASPPASPSANLGTGPRSRHEAVVESCVGGDPDHSRSRRCRPAHHPGERQTVPSTSRPLGTPGNDPDLVLYVRCGH
jgi:hypothetical protein